MRKKITVLGPDFCQYCNALLPEKLVTVYRHRRGQHFIFERVPSPVCQRCGERYFVARVVLEIDRLMKEPKPPSSLVSVPVLTLPPSG